MEKSYVCHRCDERFCERKALNKHIHIAHDKEINATLSEVWLKTFSTKSNLKKHLGIHSKTAHDKQILLFVIYAKELTLQKII